MRATILVSVFVLSIGATAAAQVPHRPATYGTSRVSYVEIPAIEFFPTDSTYTYSTAFDGGRYTNNCGGDCMYGAVHLPSGAKVVYLELDYYDADPGNWASVSLQTCDFLGANCSAHPAAGAGPMDCISTGFICSGMTFAGGANFQSADLTPDDVTVDNLQGSMRLIVGTGGVDSRVIGVIVGYVLQVSAPPGAPSFNDVPMSHPFFQFIEALKASGITGGCQASPPLYCPDSPLTRGQMAVFLAKGLGLQWP